MISSKILKVKDGTGGYLSYGTIGYGCFSCFNPVNSRVLYAFTCRESFHYDWLDKKNYLAIIKNDLINDLDKINEFWNIIQKKLKLKSKVIFYRTQYKNCIVMKCPKFWTENNTRRELVTLFVRAAMGYSNSFNKALQSYTLTNRVIPAINHFLNGNIHPIYKDLYGDNYNGFVSRFSNIWCCDYRKALVKNKPKRLTNN